MDYDNERLRPSGVCPPPFPNSPQAVGRSYESTYSTVEKQPLRPAPSQYVGLYYEWDNGAALDPNIPCYLTVEGETTVHELVEGKKLFCLVVPGKFAAKLLPDYDAEKNINEVRQQIKNVLDAIIENETAEAAVFQRTEDEQGSLDNFLDLVGGFSKGFFYSGVGLVKNIKEWSDLVNPLNQLSNALTSAWNAKSTGGQPWVRSFIEDFSKVHTEEFVQALGFDPGAVGSEDLASAYEIACFINEDAESKAMLKSFAVAYVDAQHRRELADFSGALVFEIVLTALLIASTGGAGVIFNNSGAISGKAVALLKTLGELFKILASRLKAARVKKSGHVEGITGAEARVIAIPRPASLEVGGVSGETSSTAFGKQVHKVQAEARRASGLFDDVGKPIKYKGGHPLFVPKRIDLKTGQALPGSPMQTVIPDAVSFDRALIVDDKPVGRPVAKDRQEIIRFIKAYEIREGRLPETIAIQRYDPKTGNPVQTDLYSPDIFLPQDNLGE